MKPVRREEILDYETYSEQRAAIRASAMAAKEPRRIPLGAHLCFLFENHETIRYQILEMVRVERMVREADIRHEIDTYNELLGGEGELGVTLLVEIDDAADRARLLPRWLALPERVYVELEDGRRVRARIDERQRDERRLSAVQYLKFAVEGAAPVAVGVSYPEEELVERVELTAVQRAALAADLGVAAG
jgi:hypothetical protein